MGNQHADAVYIDDSQDVMYVAEFSIKALKHVFIAKPDIFRIEQIRYLKKLAEESGVVLQMGTGYKYCPAYNVLIESAQTAKVVDVRQQLTGSCNLKMELFYLLDFVTNILNVNIVKCDVRTWKNAENAVDTIHYCLECDNGSMVNITVYTVVEGEPKLEISFVSSETVIFADVFKSIIQKQYRTQDATDCFTLDAYCNTTIYDYYIQNFNRAINKETDAIRTIEKQFENIVLSFDF